MIEPAPDTGGVDLDGRFADGGGDDESSRTPDRRLPAATEQQAVVGVAVFWISVDAAQAWVIAPKPLAVLGPLTVLAMVAARSRRSPAPIVVAIAALGLVIGGWADRQYLELPAGRFSHLTATLASDARPVGAGWQATVAVIGVESGHAPATEPESLVAVSTPVPDGARLQVEAYGRAGFVLQSATVGERLVLTGSIRPVGDRPWLRARHVVARASLDEVNAVAPAGVFHRLAESVRDVIEGGGAGFDPSRRALYTGLVIGDDRFQPLSQQARFRVTGLSHLLAVSGQNVAFVLLVVWPLAGLLPYRWRFAAIGVALGLFVLVTRAEPSVLRATACAALATWAHLTGRDRSGIRVLAGGVAALLVVDPFLVDVVGFQLSVGASAGIVVLAPVIVDRIGVRSRLANRLLIQPVAVTVAAQLGVAPLLMHYFGPLSMVALPANLLAGWAAGAVMTLGLTAGPVAGLLHRSQSQSTPAVVADLIQAPTEVLLWWIDSVAAHSVWLAVPQLDGPRLAMLVGLLATTAVRPRRVPAVGSVRGSPDGIARVLLVAAAAGLVVVTGDTIPTPPPAPASLAPDCQWIPEATVSSDDPSVRAVLRSRSSSPEGLDVSGNEDLRTVLMVGAECSRDLVDTVLRLRIRSIDIVVTERGDGQARVIASALTEVTEVDVVLGPPLHRIRSATRLTGPLQIHGPGGLHGLIEPSPTRTRLRLELAVHDR